LPLSESTRAGWIVSARPRTRNALRFAGPPLLGVSESAQLRECIRPAFRCSFFNERAIVLHTPRLSFLRLVSTHDRSRLNGFNGNH
jgi:hypothetical protein